jgi:hypothetical protein
MRSFQMVYAIIFTVYEGILGNYDLIPNVYDLILGDYAGIIAGNEGICGVLKGENRRFAALKTSVFREKVLPDGRIAGIKMRNQTKARACHSTILLLLTIAG